MYQMGYMGAAGTADGHTGPSSRRYWRDRDLPRLIAEPATPPPPPGPDYTIRLLSLLAALASRPPQGTPGWPRASAAAARTALQGELDLIDDVISRNRHNSLYFKDNN